VLLFTLIVSSTIGLFYYLRIVVVMYAQPTAQGTNRDALALPMPLPSTVALAALTGLVFLLGIYPAMFWDTIVAVTRNLG
jgi:NADH-quinone oxidoreductase subunit N